MLIDEPKVMDEIEDSLVSMILSLLGQSGTTQRLDRGVYQIGHFNGHTLLRGYEQFVEGLVDYKGEYFGSYGVCDDYRQVIEKCPTLNEPDREFVITVTPVRRSEQSPMGGWRWHKWGEYIGVQDPQHEHLYDEKDIEMVYVYHIYEKVK